MCNEYPQHHVPSETEEYWIAGGRSLMPEHIKIIDAQVARLAAWSPQTAKHSEGVAHYMEMFATDLGLAPLAVLCLTQAARLHDIGKLMIDNIQLDSLQHPKGEALKEYMRHPEYGEQIILAETSLPLFFRRIAAAMALDHHQRYDGEGFPKDKNGLPKMGDAIDLIGRISTLPDTIEAMAERGRQQPQRGVEKTLLIMDDPNSPYIPGKFDPKFKAVFIQGLQRRKQALIAEQRWYPLSTSNCTP